jgi:hypothetical protein
VCHWASIQPYSVCGYAAARQAGSTSLRVPCMLFGLPSSCNSLSLLARYENPTQGRRFVLPSYSSMQRYADRFWLPVCERLHRHLLWPPDLQAASRSSRGPKTRPDATIHAPASSHRRACFSGHWPLNWVNGRSLPHPSHRLPARSLGATSFTKLRPSFAGRPPCFVG